MLKKNLSFSQPLYLLFSLLASFLGAGMARYLGASLDWPAFLLALLAALAMQVSASLLNTYFRIPFTPLTPEETPRQRERSQALLLQVSLAAFSLFGGSVAALALLGKLTLSTGLLLFLSLALLVAYAVPPLRLSTNGYGELALAIHLSTLLPALAFLLQADEFHRLLPLTAFPLTLLTLAYLLAANFSTYAADQKQGRQTLLIRLGWQRAIPIHHALILSSFLLFAAAPLLGVSWGIMWPVFLCLPFGLFQIVWLQRIANGGAPVWKFFNVLMPTLLLLTAYLLTLSFWLH